MHGTNKVPMFATEGKDTAAVYHTVTSPATGSSSRPGERLPVRQRTCRWHEVEAADYQRECARSSFTKTHNPTSALPHPFPSSVTFQLQAYDLSSSLSVALTSSLQTTYGYYGNLKHNFEGDKNDHSPKGVICVKLPY